LREREHQDCRGSGHAHHSPVFSTVFRVLALLFAACLPLLAQDSGLDSLPSSFTPDSLATTTWDDSTRTAASNASSARWTMTSRDGVVRRALSVRTRDLAGISAEVQHSDPGGLRRRTLQWKAESFALRAGDLSPWARHPLLEGASRKTGSRDTALDRQFLYGAGTRPNGVDLEASVEGLKTMSRGRWERDANGRVRGSGAALVELDGFCLGARASDPAPSEGGSHAFVAGVRGEVGHIELAWLDREGAPGSAALDAAATTDLGASRWQAKIRMVPAKFRHDGMATGWTGTSAAQLRSERNLSPKATVGMQLDGLRDSTGKVSARGASSVHVVPTEELDLSLRAGLSENQTRASRWFVFARLAARLGDLSPFAEMSVRDSLGIRSPTGRAGIKANRGNQELLASATMSPINGATWTASHKTRLETGAARLEFALSASGAARSGTPVTAQGSVACAW